ncbi:hypothetical protein A6V39_05670 [Candidatus Mycoplasma haematobovis]|uniref:Type I restriction enzyme endonuclease subunit n=1 Tax=Candidatus Mycoplasma haematobovis TaxID=432608 RepID=A0A1A9QGG1_9MOLU|nr:HsdR family type I site-specific deoxyribonuclease [Candidatus Mycoplasma haematobovis]OAL10810.1 hypothetical protein A6V39_05670 [Candidatus Mycoplasma haematobovis]
MDSDYSEKELVEKSALNLLEHELGWTIRRATEVSRWRGSEKSPLLIDDLFSALRRLNPWINDVQIIEIINKLEEGNFNKFNLRNNRNKYYLIRDGINVTVKKQGIFEQRRAILIDFSNSENNLFTAVSQLHIKGSYIEYLCKPDLLGFVNGLPLLFMEFKAHKVDVQGAYSVNYLKYLEQIPQLFAYNAFCVFSNGLNTKIGEVGSKYEFFKDWQRLTEDAPRDTKIENLLRGVCDKDNFLDLFENFILFSESNNNISKIVARNHQFLGVNLAFESYRRRHANQGRLGTFWHTQGSGKSYSMMFFAEKIRRKCGGSPVFVILTDRRELDKQIYDTFVSCGVLGGDNNCIVENKKDLEKKLREKHSYVFSLIHKFGNADFTPIESDKEIIIIADEAHRTQYGEMSEAMYRFLPTASRIGFTGTPLLHDEQITARYFGDYISQYDFLRAIEDKVTVPLIYENRACKNQNIVNPEINIDVTSLLEEPNLTLEEKNNLQKRITQNKYLWMMEDRLRKNAQDFVTYYSAKLDLGKALYVCLNRKACVLMKNYVKEYWNKEKQNLIDSLPKQADSEREVIEKRIRLMDETDFEIVVSNDVFDEEEIFSVYGSNIEIPERKEKEKSVEDRFKDKDDNLRVVFVCAMWLTGFDVPCLSFLFLDKPLKAHTLMQAIARPNRMYVGKKYGVIVDYMNCFAALADALKQWSAVHKRALITTSSTKEIAQKVVALIDEIEIFLKEQGIFLDKFINEKDREIKKELLSDSKEILLRGDIKDKFDRYYWQLINEFKYILRQDLSEIYRDKFTTIKAIYEQLHARSSRVSKDDLITKLFAIIQKYVKSDVNKENYSKEISNTEIKLISSLVIDSNRQRSVVNEIRESFEADLKKAVDLNPSVFNLFNEYNKLIEEWNKAIDPDKLEELFPQILGIVFQKWKKEQFRHKEEGFSNVQSLAIYDICKEWSSEEILQRLKDFCESFFFSIREQISNTHDLFEKESTKSELLSFIKESLFVHCPCKLTEQALFTLREALFSYLFNIYQKNLLYFEPQI